MSARLLSESSSNIYQICFILIKHPQLNSVKRLLYPGMFTLNIIYSFVLTHDPFKMQEFLNWILPPIYTFNLKNLPPLPFMNSILLFVLNESKYTIWASWESCKFKRKWSFVNISLFFSNTVRTLFFCPHFYNETFEEEFCIFVLLA